MKCDRCNCEREVIQTTLERIIEPESCPSEIITSTVIRTDVVERLIPGPPGSAGPAGNPGPAGPAGPAGSVSGNYRSQVEPVGARDSVNLVFTFPEIPLEATFEFFQNGLLEDPANYTLVGNTLTLTTAPRPWWRLAACYFI